MSWSRAAREALRAAVLVAVVAFVGGNFVLVDVRLFGWTFQTRLAWIVVIPAALAYAAGALQPARRWWTRRTAIEPSPTAEATRLIEPEWTSPTAKMPGRLVSRK
jgi:hypothetical protein